MINPKEEIMKIITVAIMLFSLLVLGGCRTAKKAGEEVGKPIGKTFDAVGGISDGALEGYLNETPEEDNPYGR